MVCGKAFPEPSADAVVELAGEIGAEHGDNLYQNHQHDAGRVHHVILAQVEAARDGQGAQTAAARGAEVALFGHTHKPIALQKNGVFLFNPGSCGRCYTGPNTYGVMLLDKGKITSFAHKEVPQQ